MSTITAVDPRTHDEAIAAEYHVLDKARQRCGWAVESVFRAAGFEREPFTSSRERAWTSRYVGENGRWAYLRRTFEEAVATCREDLDKRNLSTRTTPREALATHEQAIADVAEVRARIAKLEESYTGWSRFFLVTSSAGHIHSSMHCSSCRPTTAYGWLPELSGKTEREAVEAHGPALCSVCFASAPVEMQGGKITAAKALKLAA